MSVAAVRQCKAENLPLPIMSQCTYCDAFVSTDFVRVFGDENGRVYACPNCTANAGIQQVSTERKAAMG
jgi:hypothetical protein